MAGSAEAFEDLEVWREAHAMVVEVYSATRGLPEDERYGLMSQMRRAAVSVPANIVEGFKRRGRQDKEHFYNIAQSSLEETRYYVILCRDLGYALCPNQLPARFLRVGKLLTGLIRANRS